MQSLLDYILRNKEWIFSGVGVVALTGGVGLLWRLLFRKRMESGNRRQRRLRQPEHEAIAVPPNWHGIVPENSKYTFVTKKSSSIPLGSQPFAFEYGPEGHAHPLKLKGSTVRAEVQFTCRITNPYKAAYAASDFALNVLPPIFLVQARGILERYSLSKLRADREIAAREIVESLKPQFGELGVLLESVTIGALDVIERAK